MALTGRTLTTEDWHGLTDAQKIDVAGWLNRHNFALRDVYLVEQDELAGCVHVHRYLTNDAGHRYQENGIVASSETVIGGSEAEPFPHWPRRALVR